ncbi:MAG: FtsH protease activity modulator HflK [Verrucomicrobiales bacterium]|nr:FtsH protease activity modulator HflK [Verrucomicrobiales bacterium]
MRLQVGNQVVDINIPGSTKGFILALLLALVGYTVYKGVYMVQQEEEAVVTRFGKYTGTVTPGLHFKIPYVDDAQLIKVRRQQKLEFGFGTREASNEFQHSTPDEMLHEKSMVTGDLNAALVEWVVQYRITNPKDFVFNVEEPLPTLRDATESVMREVVGDRTVDEVITVGRQEIEDTCKQNLSDLVDLYALGITIDQVQLKDVDPPREVQASFNEVNQAQQEKEKSINVANGQYNKAVPKARGDADKMISEAEGYATKRINEAEGDVAKFVALYKEYDKSPDVTRRRIYLETMERVMPQIGNKVILDQSGSQAIPLLPLNNLGLNK